MRLHQRESARLKSAETLVEAEFRHFGVNKAREITRLLYEIAKREGRAPAEIAGRDAPREYHPLKTYLLKRRYPLASSCGRPFKPYLPKLEFGPDDRAPLQKKKFYPRRVIVEKKAAASMLAARAKKSFPEAGYLEIESLKDYRRLNGGTGRLQGYNNRRDDLFIVSERYDFFKRCPCTGGAYGCGYHVFNLGFGCIFDCAYCYLQDYANFPGIFLPANTEDFFEAFRRYGKKGMRLGTGEFTDSLALDRLSGYSIPIIEFFRGREDVIFEFKTKSAEIHGLLAAGHSGNIVVSWSLNPQNVIDTSEYFTASLEERLDAASRCEKAGYRLGFHLDPVIYYRGWETDYERLLDMLFQKVSSRSVAWISLGTFRFRPSLKQAIERRFPHNTILDEELIPGYDGKLRYLPEVRRGIYAKILSILRRHSRGLNVYLCMEERSIWKSLNMQMPGLI